MKKTRTTLIQLARFGDLIQTSPLIQNLRLENGKDSEIVLVVDKRVANAANLIADIDEVIEIDLASGPGLMRGDIYSSYKEFNQWIRRQISQKKSDHLILLNQGDLPSAISTFFPSQTKSGPIRTNALPAPHKYLNAALSDRRFNPLHLGEIWASYSKYRHPLLQPKIVNSDLGTPFAYINGSDELCISKNNSIAINLGAGAAGRRISAEKVAQLVVSLFKRQAEVIVLTGTKDDQKSAEWILSNIQSEDQKKVFDVTGKTNLTELSAILNEVNVLISSDTGTLQLAASTKAKPLGIFFAGANPIETGPLVDGAVALVSNKTFEFNEDNISNELDKLDLDEVARIAIALCKKSEKQIGLKSENNSFNMLVARSSSMGIEYTPEEYKGIESPVGKGRRWLPLIRELIHFGKKKEAYPKREFNNGFEELSDVERGHILNLVAKIADGNRNFDSEDLWLSRILISFWTEMNSLINVTAEN
jgi:ADP-heptose:LPS heptosyltransferase